MPRIEPSGGVGRDEIAQRLDQHVGGEHGEAGCDETLGAPVRRLLGAGVALQPQTPGQHQTGHQLTTNESNPQPMRLMELARIPTMITATPLDGVPGDGEAVQPLRPENRSRTRQPGDDRGHVRMLRGGVSGAQWRVQPLAATARGRGRGACGTDNVQVRQNEEELPWTPRR